MPRLLLVSRSYWPMCNEAALRFADWVDSLVAAGMDVTVLTAKWHASWPNQTASSSLRIERISPPPTSNWNRTGYLRQTWRWIERRAGNFDHIYLDSPSLLPTSRPRNVVDRGVPVAIRLPHAADAAESTLSRQIASALSLLPGGVFVPQSSAGVRQAIAAGVPPQQLCTIPQSIWRLPDRPATSQEARRDARERLRQLSCDFAVPQETPLLVAFCEDRDPQREGEWLRVLIPFLYPPLRLRVWIVGLHHSLRPYHTLLKDADCHHDCLLHGSFDQPLHLLRAADAVICPAWPTGSELIYPLAIAAGCPLLMAEPLGDNGVSTERPRGQDDRFGPLAAALAPQLWDCRRWADRLSHLVQHPDQFRESPSIPHADLWQQHRQQSLQEWLELFRR